MANIVITETASNNSVNSTSNVVTVTIHSQTLSLQQLVLLVTPNQRRPLQILAVMVV